MYKIKRITILFIITFILMINYVSAYSTDVELKSNSKIQKGQTVEVIVSVNNIDATETRNKCIERKS